MYGCSAYGAICYGGILQTVETGTLYPLFLELFESEIYDVTLFEVCV